MHNRMKIQETETLDLLRQAQEFKFMVHRSKGGWEAKPMEALVEELKIEVDELCDAISNNDKTDIITEAADIANYCAMIIEKALKG